MEEKIEQQEPTVEQQQEEQLQEEQLQDGQELESEEITDEEVDAEKRIAELEVQVADLKDKNLRMMAEFDNYRRRTSREKLELKDNTQDEMLREFLPLVDDFDRAMAAMQNAQDIDALRDGMQLIYDKVADYLKKYGVKQIETDNAPFDVEQHEAIAMLPAPTEEQKGKVIDCVKKGYTRNDKVLRHAQVAVGQ